MNFEDYTSFNFLDSFSLVYISNLHWVIIYIIITLLVIILNVGAALTILIVQRQKTSTNIFFLSLIFSYILTGLLVLPVYTLIYFFGFKICYLKILIVVLLNYVGWVSLYSILAIAIERYVALNFPVHFRSIRNEFCYYVVLAIWLISFCIVCPILVKLIKRANTTCVMTALENKVNHYLQLSFGATVPLCITVILYLHIAIKLLQKNPALISSASIEKRNKSIVKMVFTFVIVYSICNLPFYFIVFFKLDLGHHAYVFHTYNAFINTDHWFHVLVYLYFNTTFRHDFFYLFTHWNKINYKPRRSTVFYNNNIYEKILKQGDTKF